MKDFSHLIKEKIISVAPLSGGCIGACYHVCGEYSHYFVKHYARAGVSIAEAHGLHELAKPAVIRVPKVITFDQHTLVLEFIQQAPRNSSFQIELGKTLAKLHQTSSAQFGFYEDNFIGSTVQKNSPYDNWIDFYLQSRLGFQVNLAADQKITSSYKRFKKEIPHLLKKSLEAPSLIHGDLWSGNVIADESGNPVLIDPAVCYAHRELELGMTKLFGGFTTEFYRAYDSEFPLKEGWQLRVDLYKLYHVLNHYNLFSGSYKQEAIALMHSYL